MVLLTMIVRVADSLPLAASMQEDEQSGRDLQKYQSQAKQLCRKLNDQSPARCTLEAGAMAFHYVIEKGVCYLALCEAGFPRNWRLPIWRIWRENSVSSMGQRSHQCHGHTLLSNLTHTFRKPKSLTSTAEHEEIWATFNSELHDVQRIMVANIEEVLQRGEALSALDSKASNLSSLSKKYRSDAKYLNTRSTYAKVAAGAVIFITLIVYVRFWWL
ncbi:hypothetical protein QQF64_014433 [Cirrhinus molitorella]|uniref:Vesicle-trafficking protein SEC22b-B n=1 Tax=Cirrhinus molitorella TaxID=172907 RepID=A0ABR3NT18_9TELE